MAGVPTFNRSAAVLGTAFVILRGVPLVLHSAAHMQLGIYLPAVAANLYIAVVLFAAPVVAAILLWTNLQRAGAWLLFCSMLGSLLFEGYNHFLAMSPDHVSQVPHDGWGQVFVSTAVVSIVLAAAAMAVSAWLLAGPLAAKPRELE